VDVRIYHTNDNGEINIVNGTTELTGGFDSLIYLALFGGNSDDPGGQDTTLSWWGNLLENEESKQYRSKTQYLLRGLPATSANLQRLKVAVEKDLQFLLDLSIASSIDISVRIPALNKIEISGSVKAEGNKTDFLFVENWESTV